MTKFLIFIHFEGEHGVGKGKVKHLKHELGENTLQVMKSLKLALDPNNIMKWVFSNFQNITINIICSPGKLDPDLM